MSKYIVLLRGINVGGYRKIKMNDLKKMFRAMGFKSVTTYIQSGNVVFDAQEQDKEKLAAQIGNQIEETFGFDVPVIIRTASDLEKNLEQFPFKVKEDWRGYITFLSGQPSNQQQEKLEALSSTIEMFRVGDRAVYIQVDKQTDKRPLFSSNFIQKKLDMPATNRNLRTVRKLLELASTTS